MFAKKKIEKTKESGEDKNLKNKRNNKQEAKKKVIHLDKAKKQVEETQNSKNVFERLRKNTNEDLPQKDTVDKSTKLIKLEKRNLNQAKFHETKKSASDSAIATFGENVTLSTNEERKKRMERFGMSKEDAQKVISDTDKPL